MNKNIFAVLAVVGILAITTPAFALQNGVTVTPEEDQTLDAFDISYQNDNGANSGMHGMVFDSNGDRVVSASADTFCVMADANTPCVKNLSTDWLVSGLADGTYTVGIAKYGGGSDQSATVNQHNATISDTSWFGAGFFSDTFTLTSPEPEQTGSILSTSTMPSTIAGWVGTAIEYIGIALAGLIVFAIGYAVSKGAVTFVLKRLHILT